MPAPTPPGLCGHCRHARVIQNMRGSRFQLCERSREDPAFARYPRLPVLRCDGYEPHTAAVPDRRAPDNPTREERE